MYRISPVHVGIAAVLLAPACRPHLRSWPSEPADLTGQVVEVRSVRGMAGGTVAAARSSREVEMADNIQRLRIRVIGSRSAAPGTQAYVGVDGITEVARQGASPAGEGRPELEGAFVRIWFRGVPQKSTPTELAAMARLVAVDSLASTAVRQ